MVNHLYSYKYVYIIDTLYIIQLKKGHFRESNPGPLAPKARIIPLDQSARVRRPGLEPGSPAWKADMLTPTPTTRISQRGFDPRSSRLWAWHANHCATEIKIIIIIIIIIILKIHFKDSF